MNHTLARIQAGFLAGWLVLWMAGRILPGGIGRLAYSTRNLLFLLLSAITVWIGYSMFRRNQKYILFYMTAHVWLVRRLSQPTQAAGLLRQYKRSSTQLQHGQVLLLTGSICLAVGLYYFLF